MGESKKREAKARARGEAKDLAEAILRAFKVHRITLDPENRQAIRDCRDTAFLMRLLDKALVAESAADVLADLEKAN